MADPLNKTITSKSVVENSPENLSMVDVMAIANQYGGFVKSCRYFVRIRPRGPLLLSRSSKVIYEQLSYMCEAAEMPGRGFMNIDARYHGPNFKMPFQSTYEDTSMTFLCRKASYERMFFDNWMEIINPTNTWNFAFRDDYSALIDIYQLTDVPQNPRTGPGNYTPGNPTATYQFTLHDAYPLVVNPQQVTWADDNFQRLTITFTYSKWTRPKIDAPPYSVRDKFIQGSTVTGLPTPSKI